MALFIQIKCDYDCLVNNNIYYVGEDLDTYMVKRKNIFYLTLLSFHKHNCVKKEIMFV